MYDEEETFYPNQENDALPEGGASTRGSGLLKGRRYPARETRYGTQLSHKHTHTRVGLEGNTHIDMG